MKRYIPILGFILVVGWMMVIFYFSSRTSSQIDNNKSFFVNWMIRLFEGSKFNNYSASKQQLIINNYSFYLSKTAHFFEYGILCYFCFLTFFNLKKYKLRYIISLIICLLYAISDEYHQFFSSGRNPRVQDVMIDFLGALTMVLCIEFVITTWQIIRIGKKND